MHKNEIKTFKWTDNESLNINNFAHIAQISFNN